MVFEFLKHAQNASESLVQELASIINDPSVSSNNKGELHHLVFHTNHLSLASKRHILQALFDLQHYPKNPPPEPLNKFHLFPSLPKEIRLQIWNFALPPPRLIELEIVDHTSIPLSDAVDCPSPTSVTSYTDADDIIEAEDLDDNGGDNDESDWQDVHDWHPALRTRVTEDATPALLQVCSESRIEALKYYTHLSTGGFIDYARDAIYLSRHCTVTEPGPPWDLEDEDVSAFALLDCTLTEVELARLRFLALERDIWNMEDGASAALVKDLRMIMFVDEPSRKKRVWETGEYEIRLPHGELEQRVRDLRMEGLPDTVMCAELVRIGQKGYQKSALSRFMFEGFGDYVRGSDERLTKDMPRQWRKS